MLNPRPPAGMTLPPNYGPAFIRKFEALYKDLAAKYGIPTGRYARFSEAADVGKGTFFLVDRKTRNVLWSTYEKPAGTRPEQLKHTAEVVAKQFRTARTGK